MVCYEIVKVQTFQDSTRLACHFGVIITRYPSLVVDELLENVEEYIDKVPMLLIVDLEAQTILIQQHICVRIRQYVVWLWLL